MQDGYLHTKVTAANDAMPVPGAKVTIYAKDGAKLYEQTADAMGDTPSVALTAPDAYLTQSPETAINSYATYDVGITAPGYHPVVIHDVEIVATQDSLLPVFMHPNLLSDQEEGVTRVYHRYIHHEAEQDSQPESTISAGQDPDHIDVPPPAVLSPLERAQVGPPPEGVRHVFIPTYIIVHLGSPSNANARNVRVPFIEYIANVASSEIFPTWPEASLRANIHAITTFALNRIYTEWYRSRGHNFDITNSTQFDQFYVHGRNIFDNLMSIAAEVYSTFVRREGFTNPFFTSYCNGTTSTCRGMSQWGTVTLANQGMDPLQILRRFYGNDIELVTTDNVRDITETFPGTPLRQGDNNRYVQLMQLYLNRIRQNFPLIPRIENPTGQFDSVTEQAVRAFQRTNNLPQTGVIDRGTWQLITRIYVAVTRLAELDAEGHRVTIPNNPPTTTLRQGSRGNDVRLLQFILNRVSQFYEFVPAVTQDGNFGPMTRASVEEFQRNFRLTPDGVVGGQTWGRLFDVYRSIRENAPTPPTVPPGPPVGPPVAPPTTTPPTEFRPPYPGTLMRRGSRSEGVRTIQRLLNRIRTRFPAISPAPLTEDGIFGPLTETAVRNFQRIDQIAIDGIVGPITWNRMLDLYNSM